MPYSDMEQGSNTQNAESSGEQYGMWAAQATQPLASGVALDYSKTDGQSQAERTEAATDATAPSTLAMHRGVEANEASSHAADPAGHMESVIIPQWCRRCGNWYFDEENGPQACSVPHSVAPLATRLAGQKATYPGLYFPCCGTHQLAITGLTLSQSLTCPATPHIPAPVPRVHRFEPASSGQEAFGCFDSTAPPSNHM